MKKSAVVAHSVAPLLGVSTGLRSFTPLAVIAWFARSGKLPVEGTWASWFARPGVVVVLTVAAAGECVADKLPNAPDRTLPVAVAGRVILSGLAGAVVATALRRPVAGGIALGVLGAVAGTYGGFYARTGLAKAAGRDWPVALAEDGLAMGLAVGAVRRLTE